MGKWSDPVDIALSQPVSRSMRIDGYSTSVRLEGIYWQILDRIAHDEGMTTANLVGEIYHTSFSGSNHTKNFASLLRVLCTRHLTGSSSAPSALRS